ncbi:MAG: hypothetical protein CVU50_06795 [Candidatus Cloacimonetes bacterium HGW-Cloacimonetes-3]|nr:MAG: hypothetical protein CVU50_06795 [Candidatus Cloacimonetes bacterium HGW-Cloacimonetes-3]
MGQIWHLFFQIYPLLRLAKKKATSPNLPYVLAKQWLVFELKRGFDRWLLTTCFARFNSKFRP